MPIGVFAPRTAPVGGFATSEWIVFYDGTGNLFRYWRINAPGTSFTALATLTPPYQHYGVASDGKFLFISGAATPNCRQYAWDGAAITQRLGAALPAPFANGPAYDWYFVPGNPGVILCCGGGGFTSGVQAFTFQSAPTYVFGTPTNFQPVNQAWFRMLDVRVGNVGEQGYGKTLLVMSVNNGERTDAFTVAGTTVTSAANISTAGANGIRAGVDRDTGLIARTGVTANLAYLQQINMTTRALSAIGNGTITGTNIYAITALKGFVVTYENGGNVRSYSRSGSTLTLVSTLALGGTPSRGAMIVSPYTNWIYLTSDVSGSSRIISLSDTGVLTSLCTLTGVTFPVTGTYNSQIAFLPAALPTV